VGESNPIQPDQGQLVSTQLPEPIRIPSVSVDPPRVELGFPPRQGGVFPLDHEPVISVDRMGIEPITPTLQQSVASLGTCQPGYERSVRESNPVPLLTTEVCCRNTYRPPSDPGWSRTITLLGVIQASSPLDHGIKLGAEGEGLGARGEGLGTGVGCAPASPILSSPSPQVPSPQPLPKLQAPVSNRAHRPYGSQLGTCQACNGVTKGRVELPCPFRARRSERRASTYSATSPSQAARTGVEPVSRE
jgi:hypothetical protein